ncbi:MAG: YihY/virulence factor BrkB family protein [Thermoleophilaceae bacterium]
MSGQAIEGGAAMPLEHRDERETVEAKRADRGAAEGRAPDGPGGLSTTKMGTLKRTFKEFSADGITDWAAALTYYAVLAIFPALIALLSILGLVGHSATQSLLDNVSKVAPGPAKDIFTSAIKNLASSRGAAGVAFVVGLALALNAASGYVAAFTRASNSIYDVEEGRPVWKLKPQQIGIVLVLLLMLVLITVAVAVSGPLAKQVGNVLGVGSSAVTAWDIAKIPVILVVVSLMFSFLYKAAPNVRQPGFRFVSPGGLVALVVWMVASLLFALYVATFASYNKTYGAMGSVVAFLVWLWITNIAILFGAEFNSELQRSQQIEAGERAPLDQPFLEPRDTSKLDKKAEK